eukprot:20547-Rhodomonas_salina.2
MKSPSRNTSIASDAISLPQTQIARLSMKPRTTVIVIALVGSHGKTLSSKPSDPDRWPTRISLGLVRRAKCPGTFQWDRTSCIWLRSDLDAAGCLF